MTEKTEAPGSADMEIRNGVLVRYWGWDRKVRVPEGVRKIGDLAFEGSFILEEVLLPEGLAAIGTGAFARCRRLERIQIPGSVSEIGWKAFSQCGALREAVLEEGVLSIGKEAFRECGSLKRVRLPVSLRKLGERAFVSCEDLEEVILPALPGDLGSQAFYDCRKLADPEGFVVLQGILVQYFGEEEDLTLPDGIRAIGEEAFRGCESLALVHLPESLERIGREAFALCGDLRELDLPGRVREIGAFAFSGCEALEEIRLPESLTGIGDGAFQGCRRLAGQDGFLVLGGVLHAYFGLEEEVHIPAGTAEIGALAFESNKGLREVFVPESVTRIRAGAFRACSGLAAVHLPRRMKEIGKGAFARCGALREVSVPEGLTALEEAVFAQCGRLSEIRIPEGVLSIGDRAFTGCLGLKRAALPGSLVSIGASAFRFCSNLQALRIPDGVREAGREAFASCKRLRELDLPAGIRDLGENACRGLHDLEAFSVRGGEGPLKALDGVLFDRERRILLAYPPGKKEASYTVPAWVREIEGGAFDFAQNLTGLVLPEGLETIGENAFFKSGLTFVRLPESLSGSGRLDVTYTAGKDPDQALRGTNPVYFGDPRDLPEDRRTRACLGFFYAVDHGVTEILPWREAYEAWIREDAGSLVPAAEEDRSVLLHLAERALLREEDAGSLLARWMEEDREDIEVRAVLIRYLRRFDGGGPGDLSLEDPDD